MNAADLPTADQDLLACWAAETEPNRFDTYDLQGAIVAENVSTQDALDHARTMSRKLRANS
jgi:hypothetical protein